MSSATKPARLAPSIRCNSRRGAEADTTPMPPVLPRASRVDCPGAARSSCANRRRWRGCRNGLCDAQAGRGNLGITDSIPGRAAAAWCKNLSQFFDASRLAVVESLASSLKSAQGLVHATPTGMREYPGLPVPENALHGWLVGRRESSISRWKQNCCAGLAPWDAERLTAAAWRCCRPHPHSRSSLAMDADRERMLRHFGEIPGD